MASSPNPHIRPPHLPPPTTLPLRYCSHNQDSGPTDETKCLLSLLSPNPESKKNKEHYILATADPELRATENNMGDDQQKRKYALLPPTTHNALRRGARSIPGVPIIYVKRSVMVLEPMSGSSEDMREGSERRKFKTGFISTPVTGKRKRNAEGSAAPKGEGTKKAKGPNPLSMLKPKKRVKVGGENAKPRRDAVAADVPSTIKERDDNVHIEPNESVKTKRRRRHKSHKSEGVEVGATDNS